MRPTHKKLLEQNPELVRRYVRMLVRRKQNRFSRALARRIMRPKLQWDERKRKKVLDSTLRTIYAEAARVRRLGFDASAYVLNLGLYFLIAERDIHAAKIDALTHPDPWKRKLAARIILLTLHELEVDKAAGNNLRRALSDGKIPDSLRDSVTDALRTIRKAQSQAQHQFAYLRHSTIAHRDPDAIQQYRDIIEIDELEVIRIAVEFYVGAQKFIHVIPCLLVHLSTLDGLLGQIDARRARQAAQ
jgi:hypothetical protein